VTGATTKAAIPEVCGLLVIAIVVAAPAYAQGRGNGNRQGPGNGRTHSEAARDVTADPVTSSPATPQSRAAYLGSWLDDASVVGPGSVWAAVSFVAAEGGQFYFPVVDVAMGASTRTQAGVSVPVSLVDDGSGSTSASVNQAFFYGKWRLRDASKSDGRLGVAVTPVIEISRSQVDASQDISLGVPVNFEVRRGAVRGYGSAGFFTRGALFQSAALELTLSSAVSMTGTIGHTYSTSADAQNDPAGRHRTDLGIGTMVGLNRSVAVFGAVGRSMTSTAGATWAAAGLSVLTAGR
jgi:hypothetical protein